MIEYSVLLFSIWNTFRTCSYGLDFLCGACCEPQNPGVVVLGLEFLNSNQMQTPNDTEHTANGLEKSIISVKNLLVLCHYWGDCVTFVSLLSFRVYSHSPLVA